MSFSPASIPNLAFWLDASDASTFVFSSGSNVSRWIDKSPYANDLIQPVLAKQPTYTSTPGGYPGVYFSTIAKRLYSIANTLMPGNSSRTLFAVLHAPTTGSVFILGTGSNVPSSPPTAFGLDLNPPVATIWHPYVYTGSDIRSFPVMTDLVPLYAYYDSATSTLGGGYNFGNLQTRTTTLNTSPSNWFLGERFFDGVGSVNAYCCEVLHYAGILTPAQLRQVELYLGLKWGISYSLLPPAVLMNGSLIGTTTSLSLFKYEPFSYIFTPTGTQPLVLVSASTLIRSFVAQVGSEVHFEAPSGYNGTPSDSESIIIRTPADNVTYTINVTIGTGRFTAPVLTSFVLNKNTSISETYGSPILFTSPIAISIPRSLTTLPPGIGFVQLNLSNFYLTGTPLATSPATAYNILGFGIPDTSRVVSKAITITVNDEIISTSIAGGSNISNMIVDFPITDRTITALYPNRFPGNLVYTWSPTLPNGIRFIDLSGNTVSNGFSPSDLNSTIRLVGTPTLSAAYQFANSNISNYPVTLRATRQTSPQISSTIALSFSFGETVLFDPVSNVSVYTNAPIPSGTIGFTARTYFKTPTPSMQFIVATTSLPTGTVLSHTTGSSNAFLTGTATSTGAVTTTLTAQNANGVYRDISVNINVSNDVVQFLSTSTPADVCYNFIISRSLDQAKTGYYPNTIRYTATAASGTAVTYSTANLPSGVVANVSGGTLTLAGIPDTVQSLQSAIITATSTVTGADLSRNLNYQVLADTMVVSPTSGLTFFQNQTISRVQFTGTTLSERPISTWTSPNIPDGLSLSTNGFLTGTPSNSTTGNATFVVVSSTGYYSQSNTITYKTINDDALVILDQNPITVDVSNGNFSNINFKVFSYSTKPVTTFISNIFPPQNPPAIILNTNASNTTISGYFTQSTYVYPQYEFGLFTQVSNSNIAEEKFLAFPNPHSTRLNYLLDVSQTSGYIPATPSTPLIFPVGRPTFYKNQTETVPGVNFPLVWQSASIPFGSLTFGFLSDFGHSKESIVLVAGSEMYRATSILESDPSDVFSNIDSGNISNFSDIVGDYSNTPYGVYTSPGPLLMSIASDLNSNWVVVGQGFESTGGAEKSIIRTSTDDGQNWVDVSISPAFVVRTSNSRLYYNSGRYFLAQPNSVYYANSSNLSNWTDTGLTIGSTGASMAFSNQKIIVSDRETGDSFMSINNGTAWTTLTGVESLPLGSYCNVELNQGFGTWVAAITDNTGSSFTYYYSNATTAAGGSNWSVGNTFLGVVDGLDFDGLYFYFATTRGSNRFMYGTDTNMNTLSGTPRLTNANVFPPPNTRRMASRLATATMPTSLTISSSVTSASTTFESPTRSDITLFQYCGTNIPVQVTPTSNFIYYYASNLPQGLRLALDPSGSSADISGIPTLFSPYSQPSALYARIPAENIATQTQVSFRVLVPFVLKKQDNASSYTAFLRDYVLTNAAQAGRDSVALPVEVQPIGNFMRPGAPTTTTYSNCEC